MNVFAIETGRVRITKNWRVSRGEGVMRMINTLFDSHYTDWLPIYVWLIEHPEGLIIIDTGIPADANKRIWFPPFMPLIQRAAKFDIAPEQEIGPQLVRLGFAPGDVRWVVLTHLHQDHDGGLKYFPNAEFVVSRREWADAYGFKGRMNGYLNQRWPNWFQPRLIDFEDTTSVPFSGIFTLTRSADLHLVPTPGHCPGHMSALLLEADLSIFFAGDTSYSEELLLAGMTDGVTMDPGSQQETHLQIRAYAKEKPMVYLPTHDPDSASRLKNRATLMEPARSR